MVNDFTIDGQGAGAFGARLLATYKVGGTPINRGRQKQPGVQGWIPLRTEYGLRQITLPVHIQGTSPLDASEKLSRLTAALSRDPVDIKLPNGMMYFASLDSAGDAAEVTQDGCLLSSTYKLSGYAHGKLQSVQVSDGNLTVIGTAPRMACRLSCGVGGAHKSVTIAGVTFRDVQAGDELCIDGLRRMVTRNGMNDMARTDLADWPVVVPGLNTLDKHYFIKVEYYPIWI